MRAGPNITSTAVSRKKAFVVLTPGRKEILARLPRPSAPRLDVGGTVWCSWEPQHTHVFSSDQADIVLADPATEAALAQA